MFDVPVLFIVYRRPELTRKVLNVISQIQPAKLFVFADGPKEGEVSKCEAVRNEVVSGVNWPCILRFKKMDYNLGGKWGGYSAIEWFFDNVDRGIILEDDNLPHPSFFPYCEALLERYKADSRIGTICGPNFQFGKNKTPDSYFFSKFAHMWGWATWRRVWRGFDIEIKDWPLTRETKWLKDWEDSPNEYQKWNGILDTMYAGANNAWDYQFTYYRWKNRMLSVYPNANLVSNIGYGVDSTHCKGKNIKSAVPTEAISLPLIHPAKIERNKAADIQTLRTC
jgi:hypothetical protein